MIIVLLARFIVMVCFVGCFQIFSAIVASGVESKIKLVKPASSFILNSPLNNFSGLIVDHSVGIRGKPVGFAGGKVESGSFRGLMTGVFDPLSPTNLALDGNRSFWGEVGTKVAAITVTGGGNQLGGWVEVDSPIVLKDGNSVLMLGLYNNLTKDIQLNGGMLRLFSSLECNKGISIIGSGTIDLSEKSVVLRSEASHFSGNLTWTGGGQIVLYEKAVISGTWVIDAQSDAVTKIDGLGRILDFSQGGSLIVKSGSRVVFDHVVFQGLKTGSLVFEDEAVQAVFVGCSLSLSSNCEISHGEIVFSGKDSVLIAGEYVCLFSGTSRLIVDGVSLYYDPLYFAHGICVDVAGPVNIVELNGGRVVSIHKRNIDPHLILDNASAVCFGQMDLTSASPLWFRGLNSDALALQGSNLVLRCAHNASSATNALIVLAAKKRATLSDLVINNFDPQCVQYGEGADISFGNNTELFVSRSVIWNQPFNVIGNAILRGAGDVVDISSSTINVAKNATLVLQDIVLVGVGNSFGRFNLADATSSIIFKNVTIVLKDDYDQSLGKLQFQGTSSLIVTGSHIITFNPAAQCIIDGVSVVYDPLSYPDQRNVKSSARDSSNLIFRKGGSLSLINESRVEGNLKITSDAHSLQRNEALSVVRPLQIECVADVCTIDGQGFSFFFPFAQTAVISVDVGKKLTLKNIGLKDFQSDHVQLKSGAQLELSDNVLVGISRDLKLSSSIRISGKVCIDCGGNKILFDKGCGFLVDDNGELELRNGYVESLSNHCTPFSMTTHSKLWLQDMACTLSGDFTFGRGGLGIAGNCSFSTGQYVFNYVSASPLVIKSMSTLSLEQDSELSFSVPAGSRAISFMGSSSCLLLVNSTLRAGSAGIIFDVGSMQVNGNCVLDGGGEKTSAGICFKEKTFDVSVSLKASLDLQGLIIYE